MCMSGPHRGGYAHDYCALARSRPGTLDGASGGGLIKWVPAYAARSGITGG